MLATRAISRDNGLNNYLRQVPLDSALYYTGLDYATWYTNTILDYSPSQNNGTIAGATWVRLPSGLWYLHFDGTNDVVTVPANASTAPDAWTIMYWIRWSTFPAAADATWAWRNDQPYPGTLISGSENLFYIYMGANNFRTFSAISPVDANNANQWYLHAVTLPGAAQTSINTSAWYVNGSLMDTGVTDATAAQSAKSGNPYWIGRYGSTYHECDIALFRMFNVVKTPAQISDIYNQERKFLGV